MQVMDLPLPIHSRAVTRVQESRSKRVVNLTNKSFNESVNLTNKSLRHTGRGKDPDTSLQASKQASLKLFPVSD